MHEIRSNSGSVGCPAVLSVATLEQTASSEVNHLGHSVVVISQPVALQFGNLSPPAYSEIDQAPPPSYQEATGQINQPRDEESSPIPDQRGDEDYRKFEKRAACCWVTSACLIFASYITYRAIVST